MQNALIILEQAQTPQPQTTTVDEQLASETRPHQGNVFSSFVEFALSKNACVRVSLAGIQN